MLKLFDVFLLEMVLWRAKNCLLLWCVIAFWIWPLFMGVWKSPRYKGAFNSLCTSPLFTFIHHLPSEMIYISSVINTAMSWTQGNLCQSSYTCLWQWFQHSIIPLHWIFWEDMVLISKMLGYGLVARHDGRWNKTPSTTPI